MWLSPINPASPRRPRGWSSASADPHELDSSQEGENRTADPYSLFASPVSHSPPTPYETARQRLAARRRQANSQPGRPQLKQDAKQTRDEPCKAALFGEELPEHDRQSQVLWNTCDRPEINQADIARGPAYSQVKKRAGNVVDIRLPAHVRGQAVLAGVPAIETNSDKKKSSATARSSVAAGSKVREARGKLRSKSVYSTLTRAPLGERRNNVRSTSQSRSRLQRARSKLPQRISSDGARNPSAQAGGLDRASDSTAVMPAICSSEADGYKTGEVLQRLSVTAIGESPRMINNSTRYDAHGSKKTARDSISILRQRRANERNGGGGHGDSFRLRDQTLLNHSPEPDGVEDCDAGDVSEDYRPKLSDEPSIEATVRKVQEGSNSSTEWSRQCQSQPANNALPGREFAGTAAVLGGHLLPLDKGRLGRSSKRSRPNGSRSSTLDRNGHMMVHSNDSSVHDEREETTLQQMVDECVQRECYVVASRCEQHAAEHRSSHRTHADTTATFKASIKQPAKASREQILKRPSDGENGEGHLSKRAKTSVENLETSPAKLVEAAARDGVAASVLKKGKSGSQNGTSHPRQSGTKPESGGSLANKKRKSTPDLLAKSAKSSSKWLKRGFSTTEMRSGTEADVTSSTKASVDTRRRESLSPRKAKPGTIGESSPPRRNTSEMAQEADNLGTLSKTLTTASSGSPPPYTLSRSTESFSPEQDDEAPQDDTAQQPSASLTSAVDISLVDLECSIDETEAGVSSERSSLSNSKPSAKRRSSPQSPPVSFRRISVASLFRRSFSRLEEKHSTIVDEIDCKPCCVQLERMHYEKVLHLVIPEYPVSFTYLLNSWDVEIAAKIGEGSFSEVFRVCKIEPPMEHDAQTEYVIKVVPVGNIGQPHFDDLLPEMHMNLAGRDLLESDINRAPTFIGLQGMHLVRGRFTDEMAVACENFAADFPQEVEHPHPSERPIDQYFIVFFTSYDGVELETALPTLSADQKCSIVLQITLGLAAAEAAFDFEHRDLHLSNLVVSDYGNGSRRLSIDAGGDSNSRLIEFRVGGKSYWVESFGKKIALIDYGMSRLVIDETLYTSFSSSILEGRDMQRKTYRDQHALVGGMGNYRTAMPETNGLWIKFLICKLFLKRPINPSKARYAGQVNRLYETLTQEAVCAQRCLDVLANAHDDSGLLTMRTR